MLTCKYDEQCAGARLRGVVGHALRNLHRSCVVCPTLYVCLVRLRDLARVYIAMRHVHMGWGSLCLFMGIGQ